MSSRSSRPRQALWRHRHRFSRLMPTLLTTAIGGGPGLICPPTPSPKCSHRNQKLYHRHRPQSCEEHMCAE
eukprot:1049678-Amphidinium_carterae.1